MSAVAGLAGITLLRATVLLLGALLLSRLLRGASSAARHAFWTVIGVALLLLPILPAVLPPLPLPLPGGAMGPPLAWSPADPAEPPGRVAADVSSGVGASPASGSRSSVVDVGAGDAAVGARAASGGGATLLLLVLWLAGSLAAVGSLLLGLFRVRRAATGGAPAGAPWSETLERARRRVGVRRSVRLLTSPAAGTALTGGVLRPFVLLPAGAERWSSERRELVLLHELVHVRRHDVLRHVVGRLALALYWFHPLARIAARRALLAREQACDESVVALGARPSVYARHLLELSEPPRAALFALPLVDRPQLEDRVIAILGPHRRGRRASTGVAAACALLWTLGVAASTPAAAGRSSPPPATERVSAEAAATDLSMSTPPPAARSASSQAGSSDARIVRSEASGPAAFVAPPAERLQERTCWLEGGPESFAGASFTRTLPDGTPVTERAGRVGDDRVLQLRVGGADVCMRAHGEVSFEDGGVRIVLGEGAWVAIGSRDGRRGVDFLLSSSAGGLSETWWVDGALRDPGPEAAEWRDAVLPVLAGYWSLIDDEERRERVLRDALASETAQLGVVREALARARADRERTVAEQVALGRSLDSLRAGSQEMTDRHRLEVEALRRSYEATAQARTSAVAGASPRTDSARVQVERHIRAELEATAYALRRAAASARVDLRADDPAALERSFRGVQESLQLQIRRLEEALRRIP